MAAAPVVQISRRVVVSAAHRLQTTQLSDEDNVKLYGKCTNLHGHNYVVEVVLRGPVNPVTGMLINLVEVKAAMHDAIVVPLDHRCVDDLPWFREHARASTVENLAVFVWQQLSGHAESGMHQVSPELASCAKLLHCVRIWETENNVVEYFGE